MTLNITILTETRIYQSSDFRLSTPEGPLDLPAMKMVQLSYPTFDGLVCFTGLAKTSIDSDRDTADRIIEWLTGSEDARLFQVVELIRQRATDHVAEVERESGRRERLTIVVVAFVRDRAQAAIISNHEDSLGQISQTPLPTMVTSWAVLRPGDAPMVLVTGNKPTVAPADQKELIQTVIEAGEDSGRIRAAVRALNRTASTHPRAKQTISTECTVASMDSSSSGMQDIDGIQGVLDRHVNNGTHISVGDLLQSIGVENAQLVGAAFATNKPASRKPPSCRREPWEPSESGLRLIEIVHTIDLDCSALGLSDSNTVLGMHSEPTDRSRQVYWTWTEQDPEQLHYLDLGPTEVNGGCIGADGTIAVLHGDRHQPAGFVFDSDGTSRQLEMPEGMGEPTVSSMNSSGAICGSIAINLNATDENRFRPAFWDAGGKIQVLTSLVTGTTGQAVDLTDDGVVLVWERYAVFGRAVTLWSIADGSSRRVPGEIIPTARTDSGEILGFDRRNGRDAAVLSQDSKSWSQLPLNNGFAPADVNSRLTIVGNVMMDSYSNGWLLRKNERRPVILPTYRYHHTKPRHINVSGCHWPVVGRQRAARRPMDSGGMRPLTEGPRWRRGALAPP